MSTTRAGKPLLADSDRLAYRHRLLLFRTEQQIAIAGGVDNDVVAVLVVAFKDAQSERVEHPPLDGSLERASAVDGIVALLDHPVFGGIGEVDGDFAIPQPARQHAKLDFDDVAQLLASEAVEDDDLV